MKEKLLDKTWEYVRRAPGLIYRLATHETIIQEYVRSVRASLRWHPSETLGLAKSPSRVSRTSSKVWQIIDKITSIGQHH